MEPTKFENNIRQKLEEREIQPSSKAWDTLESMLPSEEVKRGLSIWWYALAASVVGVLLIVGIFNPSGINTTEVQVATEEFETIVPQPKPNLDDVTTTSVAVEQTKNTNQEIIQKKLENKVIKKETTDPITKTKTSIASQKVKQKEGEVDEKQTKNTKEITLHTQVNKVVAQVKELQHKNNTVTASEVEKLLAEAQKEITNQRIFSSSKVDPMALLGDVEYELDKSLRDKVFIALGDGYDAMKVALLDRIN